MSIIPGIENLAPERTLTSSGSAGSPSLLPIAFSSFVTCLAISSSRPVGPAAVHVGPARVGGDREARRHRQLEHRGHLGQVGALAAEQVLHAPSAARGACGRTRRRSGTRPSLVAVGLRPSGVRLPKRPVRTMLARCLPELGRLVDRAGGAVAGITLIVSSLAALAVPVARAAPTGGIDILKVRDRRGHSCHVRSHRSRHRGYRHADCDRRGARARRRRRCPTVPPLHRLATDVITETAPADANGHRCRELDGHRLVGGARVHTATEAASSLTVADEVIACTFTDRVTRRGDRSDEVVTGNTSSWIRPARFRIDVPRRASSTSTSSHRWAGARRAPHHRQGSIAAGHVHDRARSTPAATRSVFVTMAVTNHGLLIASGGTVGDVHVASAGDDRRCSGRPTCPSPRYRTSAATSRARRRRSMGGSTTTTAAATRPRQRRLPGSGAIDDDRRGRRSTTSGGGAGSRRPSLARRPAAAVRSAGTPTAGRDRARARRRRSRPHAAWRASRRLVDSRALEVEPRRRARRPARRSAPAPARSCRGRGS